MSPLFGFHDSPGGGNWSEGPGCFWNVVFFLFFTLLVFGFVKWFF